MNSCSDVSNPPAPDPGPGALTITTAALPTGTKDQPYATVVGGSGGITPYTWTLAAGSPAMPAGLSLDSATGAITGQPASGTAGSYSLTITLRDSFIPTNQTKTKAVTLTVNP